MNRLGRIGELASECQRVEWQIEVDWQINDFLSQPGEDLDCYDSPDFGSPYGRFFMRIFPNWMNSDPASKWVRLDLCRDDLGPPRTLKVSLGIRGPNGWVVMGREVERGFGCRDVWHSVDFCLRSQLSDRDSRLMPDNILTIKCEIKNVVPDYITPRHVSSFQDSSIQTDSDEVTEFVAPANGSQTLNEQAFDDAENNNGEDEDDDEVSSRSSSQVKKTKRISLPARHGSVIRSLKAIMTERRRSDFTLKLGSREWPVHRVILEGRCRYFADVIQEERTENTAGEVPSEDIKDDALDRVLQFIYTGEVEDMSVENVCGLYVAAQKFRSQDMKSMCVEYMKKNMCVELVCDALAIAKTYNEEDLNESTIEYFFQEINLIFDTKGWKQLSKNHPSIISELLKETVKRIKENRGE